VKLDLLEAVKFHIKTEVDFPNEVAPWVKLEEGKVRVTPMSKLGTGLFIKLHNRNEQLVLAPDDDNRVFFCEFIPPELPEEMETLRFLFWAPLRAENPDFLEHVKKVVESWVNGQDECS
jgi:hypothetical protein